MAVYTHISWEEMEEILSNYYDMNEWELVTFEPISDGVSNSNYKVEVRKRNLNLGSVQQTEQ